MTLRVYRGDRAALLAFDVEESLAADLAGFAIECKPPQGEPYTLVNRLSFPQKITSETKPEERVWTSTKEAPIQKFHWADYPAEVPPGSFEYTATAMLFAPGSEEELVEGPSATASVELLEEGYPKFELGFTRGYVSSQAYATRFHNEALTPKPNSGDFDTAPFTARYQWLGSHAREMIFDLVDETAADGELGLDVFAYDFDEPALARRLAGLGKRLRLFLDDHDSPDGGPESAGHRKAQALALVAAGVPGDNIKRGDFHRFAHDKILIQTRGGVPVKVLSGSANFSVRGLYVQSNNVFRFDDGATAKLYGEAFEQAWDDEGGFAASPIASAWFPDPEGGGDELPRFQVSFAPHTDAELSLAPVAARIVAAKGSVLFSIMDVDAGGGPVLAAINDLPNRPSLYAFGTTQSVGGDLKVTSPANPEPVFVPFSYLKKKVPPPFQAEYSGGSGEVIHHKFVVVDFNGEEPVVFAGSSNLAKGGEEANGDNLLAFRDRRIAETYAVEAIQLIDHYRFRAAMQGASDDSPLTLKTRGQKWAAPYFDPQSPKYRERTLFAAPAAGP